MKMFLNLVAICKLSERTNVGKNLNLFGHTGIFFLVRILAFSVSI